MRKIRIFSILLAFVVLMTSVNITAFADETNVPTISVEHKKAMIGEEVEVNISIQNNPGILGMTLELNYEDKLTLTNAVSGDAFAHLTMTKPASFSNPCRFIWDGQECSEDDIKDGVILTLTFTAEDSVELEKAMEVSVSTPGGDVYDNNLNYVDVATIAGSVTMVDFKAGDANGDKQINITDIILIRRYLVGNANVEINENAANVNDDGKVNTADIITLRRYLAGGYKDSDGNPLELLYPTILKCEHNMESVSYKAPTCTEDGIIAHWYCLNCHKYYSDYYGNQEIEDTVLPANNHTVVTVPGLEPTYDEWGYEESQYCSVCNEVLKEATPIEPLPKDYYTVEYRIDSNDTYLQSIVIENPNESRYSTQDGLVLEGLMVDGYNFKGWYTAQTGGELVTEIPAGSTGKKILYAQWEEVVYDVIFDTPDVPIDSVTYTVSKGVTLTNPSLFGYTFIGWSNDDGFIVNRIKPGTIGNITLHANWTSNRNKAVSYSKYADPIIIEDDMNGQFLMTYNIGRIENVPLSVIETFPNTDGIVIDQEYSITNSITEETAETIAEMIAETTTTSSGWTLAEEWEKIYSAGNESENTNIKTTERTDSEGNVVGGEYFVSNSSGGSSYMSTESGGSSASSSKVTTDTSKGLNASYDKTTEKYCEATLGVENKTEAGASVSAPVGIAKVSAEVKNTTTVSAEATSGRKDTTSVHVDGSWSSYVGTVDTSDTSSYFNVAANQSSNWNSTSGYTQSSQTSRMTEISSALSEQVTEKTSYNMSDSLSGGNSKTYEVGGTSGRENEYSTALNYSEGNSETTTKHVKFQSNANGYFRLVEAGTVHVFAVVGYDIKTASYYTYTYNVLDDERHEYLDFSQDNAKFDDCENGLVTFKVPFEVNEYVSTVTGKTGGLKFDFEGNVAAFNSSIDPAFDGTVVVPQYYALNNGDGTNSAYKTTGFSASAFQNNQEIETVVLPTYITKIPDYAFAGCTNLKTIVAYGVTEIGAHAFDGCTSLTEFAIDNKVVSLGENAFVGVPVIRVMAANADVADAAINSGALSITLNLSEIDVCSDVTKNSYNNKIIEIPKGTSYFALISDGVSYSNLQLVSNADETFISNIIFTDNKDVPLKLNSPKVTLARTKVVDAPGVAMMLLADNTELGLYGSVGMASQGADAVLSKNVSLYETNTEGMGVLSLTGNYLVYGTVSNDSLLTFAKGELQTIDDETFNKMLITSVVTFDANDGVIPEEEASKLVYYDQTYGALPTPTREYHTFLGWYTDPEGGTQITEDTKVNVIAPQTLYAHWELNVYTVEFDANEGTVDETSRIVPCGEAIGVLPVPERTAYDFVGWYTAEDIMITEELICTTADTITVYAKWAEHAYSVTWDTGTGYTITVNRTNSPYVNAEIGELSNGSPIYYGDVLSVTYRASAGYTLGDTGQTSITVTGDVTKNEIKASASANSYTYNIVYKSSNGTNLGSTTATYKYGTTNTISAPAKGGYNTPSAQTVKWDSTSAKTITFVYSPIAVNMAPGVASGNWYVWGTNNKYGITYGTYVEMRNRTSSSIQIRMVWTNTMKANSWYGYAQYFTGNIGGYSTGEVQIAASSLWTSGVSYDRSNTVTSGWITVPVSATTRNVSISASYRDLNGVSGSCSNTITIPTY